MSGLKYRCPDGRHIGKMAVDVTCRAYGCGVRVHCLLFYAAACLGFSCDWKGLGDQVWLVSVCEYCLFLNGLCFTLCFRYCLTVLICLVLFCSVLLILLDNSFVLLGGEIILGGELILGGLERPEIVCGLSGFWDTGEWDLNFLVMSTSLLIVEGLHREVGGLMLALLTLLAVLYAFVLAPE